MKDMERKIEFRVWNKSLHSYLHDVENVYNCLAQQLVFDKVQKTRGFTMGYDHVSDGMVWEQFTGLLDKNGKKIFEGDILKADSWAFNWTVQFDKVKARFSCIVNKQGSQNDFIPTDQVLVIGNIHDNPELIKQ